MKQLLSVFAALLFSAQASAVVCSQYAERIAPDQVLANARMLPMTSMFTARSVGCLDDPRDRSLKLCIVNVYGPKGSGVKIPTLIELKKDGKGGCFVAHDV